MNKQLSLLNYTLLGLIQLKPRTGYALMKVFQDTPMGRFSGSPGAIYPALKSLEDLELICGVVRNPDSKRPGRAFHLTSKGRTALRKWLLTPITGQNIANDESSLVLRFSLMEGVLSTDEVVGFLDTLARACDEYADSVEVHLDNPDMTLHGILALEGGIDAIRARSDWARRAMLRIKESCSQ